MASLNTKASNALSSIRMDTSCKCFTQFFNQQFWNVLPTFEVVLLSFKIANLKPSGKRRWWKKRGIHFYWSDSRFLLIFLSSWTKMGPSCRRDRATSTSSTTGPRATTLKQSSILSPCPAGLSGTEIKWEYGFSHSRFFSDSQLFALFVKHVMSQKLFIFKKR